MSENQRASSVYAGRVFNIRRSGGAHLMFVAAYHVFYMPFLQRSPV